ncbi:MAG: hypothetical protein ACJAVV_000944 [Alphaproteobacteria bacterium]|jgi:hypothetical protein
MNIVLPVDYQSFSPSIDGLGTADAHSENSNRAAIEPAQNASNSKQTSQDGASNNNQNSQNSEKNQSNKDTVNISSEGRKAAQAESSNTLSEDEKGKVQELKDRDREVRVHEQAHAAVGGQYAGSPTYEYATGPDGKRYAVGGEVSIDVSEEQKPEDTIQKMQIVRAAALAPAEPSTQDLKVAAEASQKENEARSQVSQQQLSGDPQDNEPKNVNTSVQAYEKNSAHQVISNFSASA